MKPTLDDIKAIQNKNIEEYERVRLCLDNLVCPNCGGQLRESTFKKGWFIFSDDWLRVECDNKDFKKETYIPIQF